MRLLLSSILPFLCATLLDAYALSPPLKRQDPVDITTYPITLEYETATDPERRYATLAGTRESTRRAAATYRVINICPDQAISPTVAPAFTAFRGSWCKGPTPQSYVIECSDPDPGSYVYDQTIHIQYGGGTCFTGELCVQHSVNTPPIYEGDPYPTAWCVSQLAFINLATALMPSAQREATATVTNPNDISAAFILTGQDSNTQSFIASSISVTARDANNATLGNPVSCTNCSTLNYWVLPDGLNNFNITVDMPNINDVANLAAIAWS